MTDISFRGLIHEDSLLEMQIIPQSVHSNFVTLMNSIKYGPANWTALGFWLRIHLNDGLEQLSNSMKRNGATKRKRDPSLTDELVEEKADDDSLWDKEHIDEIQGKRYDKKILNRTMTIIFSAIVSLS
jgi:hypothetical protein